ncbi:MAG: SHOCT domain-containing protein [Pseudomonadota bacterium]
MSVTGELEKLEAMRKAGTITEEEFTQGKRRVLDGGRGAPRREQSSWDWRVVALGVIAAGAIGVLAWEYFGVEPEPDPSLTLISAVAIVLCAALMRPFLGFWGWGFGGEETAFPIFAVMGIGAAALAGGAFLIGLPIIALGIAAVAVIGFVMWCWNGLFGE